MGATPDVRPLAAVAAAVTALGALDVLPVWAGLPHHAALPPLDLAADVRVLLAEAPSYPWFVAGLVAAIGLRAVVLAAALRALHRQGLAWAAGFYAVALPPALVAGALSYAGVTALYSPFLWMAVAVAVLAAVLLGPRAWRRLGPQRRWPGRLAGYLAGLLMLSLAAAAGGRGLQFALVTVSAALTALTVAWRAGDGRAPGPAPAPGAVALLLAAAAIPAAVAPVPPVAAPLPVPAAAPASARATLLLVPGIGGSSGTSTLFELDPRALGLSCARTVYFSYAGPGDGAPQRQARCPITSGAPYDSADTRRPLGELAASFRAQLAELDAPVVVVAHSQGAWVVAAGLEGRAASRVEAVVLLSAFPGHRHGYVLDGPGRGIVGTDALEALIAALRATGGTTFRPGAPLTRQLLGDAGAVDRLVRDAFPGRIRVATVTSAFDLPVMPGGPDLPGAANLCPVLAHHGALPTSPAVHDQVRDFLAGRPEAACPWWHRRPFQAFTAFGVPEP